MKKKDKLELVRKYYPKAVTTIESVNKLIDFVEDQLDLDPRQVMLADSICSDGLNSIQYPSRASEFLGPFKMGGLNGFPFTGLTGMGAFASHVPDEGAVLIYYGPHIGVSRKGELGKVHRTGQTKDSNCCGAAVAALGNLIEEVIEDGHVTELDYQMNMLEQILLREEDRILKAPIRLKEATEVFYEAIDDRINKLVEGTTYKCRYVILIGAIHINGDGDMGSFSEVRRFDVIDLQTKERKSNLLEYPI